MSLREKLLKLRQPTPLYKLQTPQVLKEEYLTNNSKKWISKGLDITDYFNYGFNEATLKLYIQKLSKLTDLNLSKLQKEYNARAVKQQATIIFKDNIPLDYGGLGIPSVPDCIPEDVEQQKEALILENSNFERAILYTNEAILNIYEHYKEYLKKLVAENQYFDFDSVIKPLTKEQNNWQKQLEKILRKDIKVNDHNNGTPERKKSKHEKKKSKKEKKLKKEKKKKHKKKHSQGESIQIVPQQIYVKEDSISLESKSGKIELEKEVELEEKQEQEQEIIQDSISDQLSKQQQFEKIYLSSPSPLYEPQIQQQPPIIPPQEQPKQRNHNWPRNLIHGILERNKNQQKR